jgi:hypothetical protein
MHGSINRVLLASTYLFSLGFLWSCKTVQKTSVIKSLLEESYSEMIPLESDPENYNEIMLDSRAQSNGREFWELYSIYSKHEGAASSLAELDRIVRKHGITTTLPYGCGTAFLSDELLEDYLTDVSLHRTKLFIRYYGTPVDWDRVKRERGLVFVEPLRWPPQSNSDYYSEKAKKALGLEHPFR